MCFLDTFLISLYVKLHDLRISHRPELQLHLSFLCGNKLIISWPAVLPNIHVITVASNHEFFNGCSGFFTLDITDMILNYFSSHCKLKRAIKRFENTLL